MSNMVAIYNPSAGSAQAASETIAELARRHNCDLQSPDGHQGLDPLVRSLATRGTKRIIVVGGDGTMSRVVNSLLPQFPDIELAVVPLGTGNDLARSLGVPLDNVEMAFDLAATRPVTPIDVVRVGRDTVSYFVNAATGGFGGEVTASLSAANKQMWGPLAYWVTAMAKLVEIHAFQLEMTLDGELSRLPVYGISVANGRYVGGGFPVASHALLNDGMLDLTIVPEMPALELLGAGLNFALGRLTDGAAEGSGLTMKRAKRVEVLSQPDMPFSLDGEATSAFEAVFEVVPGALLVAAGDDPGALLRELPPAPS